MSKNIKKKAMLAAFLNIVGNVIITIVTVFIMIGLFCLLFYGCFIYLPLLMEEKGICNSVLFIVLEIIVIFALIVFIVIMHSKYKEYLEVLTNCEKEPTAKEVIKFVTEELKENFK